MPPYSCFVIPRLPLAFLGASVVTGSAALSAAASAWGSAEAVVRSRYQEKEVHDRQRYEKDLHAWLERSEDNEAVLKGALDLREVCMLR